MRIRQVVVAVACGGTILLSLMPRALASEPGAASATSPVCGPVPAGWARCLSVRLIDPATWRGGRGKTGTNPVGLAAPNGYGPSDLRSAYDLPSTADGQGQTVAIVDAYDDPDAESDLAVYRATFGLPACTSNTGCFTKVDENGGTNYPHANTSWAAEISIDIEMVSATCPNCRILLVEGTSSSLDDLGTAVNTAAKMGANAISNSYGGNDTQHDAALDNRYYNHPGVSVTAASGDNGFALYYPATSPYVTSVGGTTLLGAANARGWTETAWPSTGGGCTPYEQKPSWQTDAGCPDRTVADVAAIADPATGVAIYDTFKFASGWHVYGGTSVASPIIASVYALAGNESSLSDASLAYRNASDLNDVVSGSTGKCGTYLCQAGAGYDGPTGNGTPNGTGAF